MFFLIAIAVPIFVFATGYILLRKKYLGKVDITTAQVQYDHLKYGKRLTWTRHCFVINQRPTLLLSGEFHYWRLPDRDRWKDVLLQYKQCGLNCIRIYFHWGYHSPSEGVYHFDGNRDIDYLLELCEQLELFVLAAPGPYICAETQGGGHPLWLIAKRQVRIRHMVTSFFRLFDSEYSRYELEWFHNILPVIAKHQITEKEKGCVLAVQIENEYLEMLKWIPIGLSDEMRILSNAARDLGVTVPLFTNDPWEEGSFVAYDESNTFWKSKKFGLDLYGFDKYVVFAPTSTPLSTIIGGQKEVESWGEWNPNDLKRSFDKTESVVRSFGGAAAKSPIFIPELQGGWFNHYTVGCTFDDIYSYFGSDLTRTIAETAISQGSTAFNIYMFYGGTNWGTLGDPDVYTSYDYSACIREYGYVSERVQTDAFEDDWFKITSTHADFIARQRISKAKFGEPLFFVFYRNLNDKGRTATTITLTSRERILQLCLTLPRKQSFIGLGNYVTKCGLKLLLSTVPILVRTFVNQQEVWIVQNDQVVGQMAFEGIFDISGDLDAVKEEREGVTIVSFKNTHGSCCIKSKTSTSSVTIIALKKEDLMTLTPLYRDSSWSGREESLSVLWGACGILFDPRNQKLTIQQSPDDTKLFLLGPFEHPGFGKEDSYNGLTKSISLKTTSPNVKPTVPIIEFSESKSIDFDALEYTPLDSKKGIPNENLIDLCFTGYTVYRISFDTDITNKPLTFEINARHRVFVYLNNEILGHHLVYSLQSFRAGAKNGPDVGLWGGWKSYTLPAENLRKGTNHIVCIVESLGLNRCPGPLNDIRNDRGILQARIKNIQLLFEVSGVDVTKLEQPFNSVGFTDRQDYTSLTKTTTMPPSITKPTWFRGTFAYTPSSWIAPLRLFLYGKYNAHISINGILIARYYGIDSPQHHFFIPEKILKNTNIIEVVTFGFSANNTEPLQLKLDFWRVDGFIGSGNMVEDGKEYSVFQYKL